VDHTACKVDKNTILLKCKQLIDITVSSNVWWICYTKRRRMVSVCMQHFDLCTLPNSNVTNANILCLVRFSSVLVGTN